MVCSCGLHWEPLELSVRHFGNCNVFSFCSLSVHGCLLHYEMNRDTHCLLCWITGVVLCTDFITTFLFMSNKLIKQTIVNWMNDLLCLQPHVSLCDFWYLPVKNDGNNSDYWNCQNLPDFMWDKFSGISSLWFHYWLNIYQLVTNEYCFLYFMSLLIWTFKTTANTDSEKPKHWLPWGDTTTCWQLELLLSNSW